MPRARVRLTRDALMFGVGAAVFIYEAASGADQPNVTYGALALMGVASYLRGSALGNGKADK